jgi:hypothetical protein
MAAPPQLAEALDRESSRAMTRRLPALLADVSLEMGRRGGAASASAPPPSTEGG